MSLVKKIKNYIENSIENSIIDLKDEELDFDEVEVESVKEKPSENGVETVKNPRFEKGADKMAPVGVLERFVEGDNLDEYLERFIVFFEINEVEESEQSKHFMLYCGKFLYNLATTVCAPEKVKDVEFEILCSKLRHSQKSSQAAEVARSKFFERVQVAGEKASEFALAIKEISTECSFGANLDATLRDRFHL